MTSREIADVRLADVLNLSIRTKRMIDAFAGNVIDNWKE